MDGTEGLFCAKADTDGCLFERYLEMMNRMLQVYDKTQKEEMRAEILKFAQPKADSISLEVKHLPEYRELLERVAALGSEEDLKQLLACTDKAVWAQDIFAGAFSVFESGDFEPIKDFMQSGTGSWMEPWKAGQVRLISRSAGKGCSFSGKTVNGCFGLRILRNIRKL